MENNCPQHYIKKMATHYIFADGRFIKVCYDCYIKSKEK